jgi:hypothetical protein
MPLPYFDPTPPDALADLAAWWKGESLLGNIDGEPVTVWPDSTGLRAPGPAVAAAQAPIFLRYGFNGEPCLRFNGGDNYLDMGATPLFPKFGEFTVFLVLRHRGADLLGESYLSQFLVSPASGRTVIRHEIASDRVNQFFGSTAAPDPVYISDQVDASTAGELSPGVPYQFAFTRKAADVEARRDGILIDTDPMPADKAVLQAGVLVGARGNGATYTSTRVDFFNGELAEIIFFNRALSDDERAGVEDYLAEKYGLSTGRVAAPPEPPPPPVEPITTPFQQDVYRSVTPLADQDAAVGWHLLKYIGAIAKMYDPIVTLVEDDLENGHPGWSMLLDPDRAPDHETLDYMGQFAGVRPRSGLDLASHRIRVKETDGMNRGSPGAIEGAARQRLTGTRTAYLLERYGSAYRFGVTTLAAETPNPAAVLADLLEQKPGGDILIFTQIPGGAQYDTVTYTHSTYNEVESLYVDYNEVLADPDKQ